MPNNNCFWSRGQGFKSQSVKNFGYEFLPKWVWLELILGVHCGCTELGHHGNIAENNDLFVIISWNGWLSFSLGEHGCFLYTINFQPLVCSSVSPNRNISAASLETRCTSDVTVLAVRAYTSLWSTVICWVYASCVRCFHRLLGSRIRQSSVLLHWLLR